MNHFYGTELASMCIVKKYKHECINAIECITFDAKHTARTTVWCVPGHIIQFQDRTDGLQLQQNITLHTYYSEFTNR